MFFHSNDDQNYKINCLICKKENKGTINFRYFENQFIIFDFYYFEQQNVE